MTVNEFSRRLVIAIAAVAMAIGAHAAPITIFNTGVNANGKALPNGTFGDPHYSLLTVPGGVTSLLIGTSAGLLFVPPWVGDNPFSAWIGPHNDSQLNGPPGNYDYRTTFDLTGFAPGTASLVGKWAADNSGVNIRINGVATTISVPDPFPLTGNPFMAFSSFSISSGFVAGVNTLDFIVNNADNNTGPNPTGLRVEISGTASTFLAVAPEPASLVLFGLGFSGLCILRRRRNRALPLR